jgi:hypothetical protein
MQHDIEMGHSPPLPVPGGRGSGIKSVSIEVPHLGVSMW